MQILIIYNNLECETADDAKFIKQLINQSLDTDGWERGIDEVDINILSEGVLSLVVGGGTK